MLKATLNESWKLPLLLILLVQPAWGQRGSPPREAPPSLGRFRYLTVQLGAINGPSLSSYANLLNEVFASFGSLEQIDDFGPNVNLGLGICASISPHFSYQINLNIYSFQTEETFNYTGSQGEAVMRRQELSLGGATFGLNLLVNPSFTPETRFWPFLGAGLGLVSFYLDELVDVQVEGQPGGGLSSRLTKIAFAGGIACGGVYKLTHRWGLILQGEYLVSKAKMDFYLGDNQEIKLNQGLLKLGAIYFYR